MNEQQRDREIAQRICQDLRWNGRSFQLGEYVVLLDGDIIAVTADPEGAIKALRSIAPDSSRGMVVEVSHPVVDVIR